MNGAIKGKALYIVSGVLILFLILLNSNKPIESDWRFDFTAQSTLPYGCEILGNNLKYVFPGRDIQYARKTVYETLRDSLQKSEVYLIINDTFEPDEFDTDLLMKFIQRGGTVFVSAFAFSDEFEKASEMYFTNYYQGSHWDSIKFEHSGLQITDEYPVSKYLYPGVSIDDKTDLSQVKIHAKNNLNKPVFFSKKFGNGTLFIHLFPIGFTNYFMTERGAEDFAYLSMAFLPEKDVIWDEYYKTGKIMIQTPLRFILSQPHLSWAYYILLLAAVLFIFLYGRREQRVIPVIKPFINSSIEYYKRTALLRKHQYNDKQYVRVLYEAFVSRVTAHFRISGSIFLEENVGRIKDENVHAWMLFQQIEKDFERVKKSDKPDNELKALILKIDNFYKLTGVYAKRRYHI